MSTFTIQWNPEEVLEIGPVSSRFNCIGYAHTMGRRCRCPIDAAECQQAINLLREMSMMEVSSPEVEESLEPLASLLLCTEHHQYQMHSVAGKWRDQIAEVQVRAMAVPEIVAEWERVICGSSVAAHQWTAQLKQSVLDGGPADVENTFKFLGLALRREQDFQAQLAELKTSNEDLKRDVQSLRTQLAHSANDPVHNRATPVTSPARARQSSADSSATFTHQISAGVNHQSPHGHSHHHIHRIRIQFELQSQSVSQPSPSFHSPLLIS